MKKPILIGGIILLLLGGATFVGGQLLNGQGLPSFSGPPRKLVTPAAGLPTAPPDACGDAIRRDGNSIFVCKSNSGMSINPNGTINEGGSCNHEVEVVIGHDTRLIHDVTGLRNLSPAKQGQDLVIQQYIEPGSQNDIVVGMSIRAWGTSSGGRVLAQTLLYWNRTPSATAAAPIPKK